MHPFASARGRFLLWRRCGPETTGGLFRPPTRPPKWLRRRERANASRQTKLRPDQVLPSSLVEQGYGVMWRSRMNSPIHCQHPANFVDQLGHDSPSPRRWLRKSQDWESGTWCRDGILSPARLGASVSGPHSGSALPRSSHSRSPRRRVKQRGGGNRGEVALAVLRFMTISNLVGC